MTKRSLSRTLWTVALGGLVASGAWAGDSSAQGTQDRDRGDSEHSERSQTPGMAGQQDQRQDQQQLGEERQGEQQYVVREGDTLADIAQRFLGSAEEWEKIADANDIENPGDLRVGTRLKIPARDEATTGERRTDESEPLS